MRKKQKQHLCIYRSLILLVLLICCIGGDIYAQHSEVAPQQVLMGRLNAPIKVEVKRNENGYVFSARNTSMFPYQFELKFSILVNLNPMMTNYKTVVQPGINRLFSLNISDKQTECNYQYSFAYRMGDPKEKADKEYPYLIPIGEGKMVEYVTEEGDNRKTVLLGFYKVSPGDTIYASRRGFVTATPNAEIELDRIRSKTSLEIRHYDGTVAVYSGLDPSNIIARLGHVVFPGQAIGLTDTTSFRLSVYEILGSGMIKSFSHFYANESPSQLKIAGEIRGAEVSYPEDVIIRELSRREIKKLKKGVLYK